jgi:hypothetical protein
LGSGDAGIDSAGSGNGGSGDGGIDRTGGDDGANGDAATSDAVSSNVVSGTWVGTLDNFTFSDGSKAITLTIQGSPLGGVATFGQSSPPPPATDPNVGYPPGFRLGYGSNIGGISAWMTAPHPGFPFSFLNPTLSGQRLQFDISILELWKAWCQLQTPFLAQTDAGPMYYCEQDWTSTNTAQGCVLVDPTTMQQVSIDCEKLAMCGPTAGICSCGSQSCSSSAYAGVHIDLTVAGSQADGVMLGNGSGSMKVHFTKM